MILKCGDSIGGSREVRTPVKRPSVESQTRDDGGLDMVGGAGSQGVESSLILNLF